MKYLYMVVTIFVMLGLSACNQKDNQVNSNIELAKTCLAKGGQDPSCQKNWEKLEDYMQSKTCATFGDKPKSCSIASDLVSQNIRNHMN